VVIFHPLLVALLESERRKPSVEVLFKLVDILDFSLDSLFQNYDDETQDIISNINLCLGSCNIHELLVVYATVEAMRKKA